MNALRISIGRRAQQAVCLLAAVIGSSSVLAAPVEYRIDPEHLSLGFLVDHISYASVLGLFRTAEGNLNFDQDTGIVTDMRVVVDTASVFTNHDKRDDHLRSADFLNSMEFPEMVFTAERAEPQGDQRYRISGSLELLGQSRPLALDATLNKVGEYPFGGGLFGDKPYVIRVSARASFERSGYGMNYSIDNGWVGNDINLIIEFEAIRQ